MERDGLWVGTDCGNERTSICIVDQDGVVHGEEACASAASAVEEILSTDSRDSIREVSVEAGVATHMIRGIRAMHYPVRVYEVGRANKFLTVLRLKTDVNDADGLAELG